MIRLYMLAQQVIYRDVRYQLPGAKPHTSHLSTTGAPYTATGVWGRKEMFVVFSREKGRDPTNLLSGNISWVSKLNNKNKILNC